MDEMVARQQQPQPAAPSYENYGSPLSHYEGKLSPQTRSRLATWTVAASPESGFAEPVVKTQSAARPGRKRRANSLENIAGEQESNGPESVSDQDYVFDLVGVEGDRHESRDLFVYPSRFGAVELLVLRQPEAQHRPRYQTEGSRGRIKDRSGSLSPAVQLKNFHGRSAILQVYVAVEDGIPRPHPLFKICKVNNKIAAPANVRELPGTGTVLEMAFSEKRDWTVDVDCVSLMKLRNVDCEEVGVGGELLKRVRSRRGTGGSAKVRLAFRAILTLPDGRKDTLQVTTTPISCCSALGSPEISFVSHRSASVTGGSEIVVLGRSFLKNDSRLLVVEKSMDDELIWESEAPPIVDKFNQVHIVCRIPSYRDSTITQPAPVYLCVRNNDGKQSDLIPFTYTPDEQHPFPGASESQSPPESFPTGHNSTGSSFISSPDHHSGGGDSRRSSMNDINDLIHSPIVSFSGDTVGTNNTAIPLPTAVPLGSTHYCIELPGMSQPIIITIPPSDPAASVPEGTYDLSHTTQSQCYAPTSASTERPDVNAPAVAVPGQQTIDYETSQAFDDLIREILGPEAVQSTGTGLSSSDESWGNHPQTDFDPNAYSSSSNASSSSYPPS